MVSVGDLYKKLITYGETAHQTKFRKDLFQYIFEEFSYRPKTVLTEPIPKVSEEKASFLFFKEKFQFLTLVCEI